MYILISVFPLHPILKSMKVNHLKLVIKKDSRFLILASYIVNVNDN